jgi:hypothetical protein
VVSGQWSVVSGQWEGVRVALACRAVDNEEALVRWEGHLVCHRLASTSKWARTRVKDLGRSLVSLGLMGRVRVRVRVRVRGGSNRAAEVEGNTLVVVRHLVSKLVSWSASEIPLVVGRQLVSK